MTANHIVKSGLRCQIFHSMGIKLHVIAKICTGKDVSFSHHLLFIHPGVHNRATLFLSVVGNSASLPPPPLSHWQSAAFSGGGAAARGGWEGTKLPAASEGGREYRGAAQNGGSAHDRELRLV